MSSLLSFGFLVAGTPPDRHCTFSSRGLRPLSSRRNATAWLEGTLDNLSSCHGSLTKTPD